MRYYFIGLVIVMILCDVKTMDLYVCLNIYETFFSYTLPQTVHTLIECKLILSDLVSKYGWLLIKICSIRILIFLYSFSVGSGSGTLGMFSMWTMLRKWVSQYGDWVSQYGDLFRDISACLLSVKYTLYISLKSFITCGRSVKE